MNFQALDKSPLCQFWCQQSKASNGNKYKGYFLGVKTAGAKAQTLTTFMCRFCRNSGSLILQKSSGSVQVWTGIALCFMNGGDGGGRCSSCWKGKAIPLLVCTGSEGSRRLRLPGFLKKSAHEGGKAVGLTHRPPSPSENILGTQFCQRMSQPQNYSAVGRIMSEKNSNCTIGNRTCKLGAVFYRINENMII